jgi:hypothetical protein
VDVNSKEKKWMALEQKTKSVKIAQTTGHIENLRAYCEVKYANKAYCTFASP